MVKYCAVCGCSLTSYDDVSLFKFPEDKHLRKVWTRRTRRKNFTPTSHSYICSKHFTETDIIRHRTKNVLKKSSIPSQFTWSNKSNERRHILRAVPVNTADVELTEILKNISSSSQTDISELQPHFGILFLASHQDKSLIKFYTGFKDMQPFYNVLDSVLPERNRQNIVYYDVRHKSTYANADEIFDENAHCKMTETSKSPGNAQTSHKLSPEDEFLLTMMKLRLGLFYVDIATRFGISVSSVQRIFYSWIKFLYIRLGSVNIFPHRDIIFSIMQPQFKQDYPNTVMIIVCTELHLAMPSSFKRQSQTYSNYKSTNTVKGLIGVDLKGGIMFVSQLYTGSISDKEICKRSGFFELLKRNLHSGKLLLNDAIMADKGFLIDKEIGEIGLSLNIPPFLKKNPQLTQDDVLTTRSIARHCIHVERAIRKIKQYHIFDRKIPINMLGILNEVWLVCCMLTNFHDPIISEPVE